MAFITCLFSTRLMALAERIQKLPVWLAQILVAIRRSVKRFSVLIKTSQWLVALVMSVVLQSAFAQQPSTAVDSPAVNSTAVNSPVVSRPAVKSLAAKSSAVKISAAPNWIKPQPIVSATDVPKDKIKGGIYYLLYDKQINVDAAGGESIYLQYAEQVVDNNGLQEAADINVEYDPAYENLSWHSLAIIRDGKRINKLDPGKFSLLHREQELENAMYNGRLTANIILDDLRVGDLLEYSYSIVGQNPVYAGHFYASIYLQWGIPIANLHFALNWHKTSPLIYKSFATEQPLKNTQSDAGSSYELHLSNLEPKTTNSEIPSWYNPYGRYVFSDFSNWAEVAQWAVPLYSSVMLASPEIKDISAKLKAESGSVEQQAVAALYYVQNNIRYLGVEMGLSSHQPSLAQDTLSRRYGDCKDKAVLLVTLLHEMGIKAAPVLVNTERRQEIINSLPAIHIFDHVIVAAFIGNKTYWIDPTRENQRGGLEDIHQANYGYGLVVDQTSNKLTAIAPRRNSSTLIAEYFDMSGALAAPVNYTVTSEYRGLDADYHRNNLSGGNGSEETEQYLNFYKSYYSDIETLGKMIVQDDDPSGILKTIESYKINKFWNDEKKPKYTASFYANGISTMLTKPEDLVRSSPYYVRHRDIVEKISAKLDGSDWDIDAEKFQEKNKYFEFEFNVSFSKKEKLLTLVYSYKTLLDMVPAEDINSYLAARERAIDRMEYSIYENKAAATEPLGSEYINWIMFGILAGFVYLLVFICVIIDWYKDKSRLLYLAESRFYPVSLGKFIALGAVTLGFYQVYWFYQNWSYIKREAGIHISPFWRAFFSIIWIYAFYKRLVFGEEVQSHRILPKSILAAVGFAVVYVLLQIGASSSHISMLSLLLMTGLLSILAGQILKIPQNSDAALQQNSRWKWRHTGVIVLCLPLYLVIFAQELKLIPSSDVVSGDRLLARDVVFMHKNKLFPVSQKIIYFYSDAIFSVRESGSGFTQSTVFSYWRDGQNKLVVKSMPIEAISKMDVSIAADVFANNAIEIYGDNGDEFVVYVPKQGENSKLFIAELKSLWKKQRGSAIGGGAAATQ